MHKKIPLWKFTPFLIGLIAVGMLSACLPAELSEAINDGEAKKNDKVGHTEAYSGPVTEIVIRRLHETQDVNDFSTVRDSFINLLKEHPGANVDREFAPFVDFLTFAPPEPAVFIGMTEYEDMAAVESASSLFDSPEAKAFIETFTPEVATIMRPLNPQDRYDLSTIATESGQVLEIAVRDLSTYEAFDEADYETKRDAFLEALSQQAGWVAEMQWVSLLDPNVVVGMTVYESAEAYQAIYAGEFGQAQVTQDFGGGYPLLAGFASFDARPAKIGDTSSSLMVAIGDNAVFPESIAVHDGYAYLQTFFDGALHKVELATGTTETLISAGTDGVIMGWGVWYDDANDVLLACGNKNQLGPQENVNIVRAVNTERGDVIQQWALPDGAMCNSIVTDSDGNIYISDVSANATIVKINRATGETITWLDDPSWENDTGFGVGGMVWDGSDNLYASASGPMFRVPINADGTAGTPVLQTILDADGNELAALGVDGFAYAGDNTMIGASFDFEAFQSQIVKATAIGGDTLQTEIIYTGAIGATGVDVDGGTVYIADGQIIQGLFIEDYAPVTPFQIHVIVEN